MKKNMDKFAQYYENNETRISELSNYVFQNHKLIMTKMLSEMRRKLNINPDLSSSEGYISLMFSLQGRLFNECVYALAGMCKGSKMRIIEILPPATILMLINLLKNIDALEAIEKNERKYNKEEFEKFYLAEIDALRSAINALPQ